MIGNKQEFQQIVEPKEDNNKVDDTLRSFFPEFNN